MLTKPFPAQDWAEIRIRCSAHSAACGHCGHCSGSDRHQTARHSTRPIMPIPPEPTKRCDLQLPLPAPPAPVPLPLPPPHPGTPTLSSCLCHPRAVHSARQHTRAMARSFFSPSRRINHWGLRTASGPCSMVPLTPLGVIVLYGPKSLNSACTDVGSGIRNEGREAGADAYPAYKKLLRH